MKNFIQDSFQNRHIIGQLTQRDFKSRYAGSMLGLFWAFLQPIAMMGILWFVFSYGLKAQTTEPGISFVAWFFTAMIAWNFFADGLQCCTQSLRQYSFLVKKMKFNVSVLPVVKIFSSLILHLIFIAILMLILVFNGISVNLNWLSVLYYVFCSMILILGLGWATSALNVFSKDIGELVNICIQFGFWGTPIIWNYKTMPEHIQTLLRINPVMYITEGYRSALLYGQAVWEVPAEQTLYFWGVTLVLLFGGYAVFNRLRVHFADLI